MPRFSHVAAAVLCLALGSSAVFAQTTYSEAMKQGTSLRASNAEGAIKAAEEAVKLAANVDQKAQAYQLIALIHQTHRQNDQAVAALEQALALENLPAGRRSSVLNGLGAAYLVAGNVDKGRETLNTLIADENATAVFRTRAQIALANSYVTIRDQRDPAKARELLLAVEKLPYAPVNDKADARHALAALEASEKNFDEALAILTDLQKQENLPPVNRARYRITLGNTYRQAGQLDKALEAFQAILDDEAATPSYKQSGYTGLATVYMQQKDYANAKKAYEALINHPGTPASTIKNAKAALERIEKLQAAQ